MNLNKFYFTMTLILVTVLLTNYVSAEEVYGDCKTIITTEVENGIEVSRNETRVDFKSTIVELVSTTKPST